MAIEFQCSVCSKGFKVDEKHVGRKTICKSCGTTIIVPQPGESSGTVIAGGASSAAAPAKSRKPPSKVAERDPQLLKAISRHVETHIGAIARIFRDQASEQKQVDLFWVKPTDQRPFHTLITCGMSEQPMKAPADARDQAYAELILCLPPEWPIDDVALREEVNYWPLRWMKLIARFPHDNSTFLSESHTVPNGDPPQPFHPSTPMTGWIFTSPLMFRSAVEKMSHAGRTIHFLSMLPLHANELQFKLQHGYQATWNRLTGELGSREPLSMRRRSFCEPRKARRKRYVGSGISIQCKCGARETPPVELAGSSLDCFQCGEPVYVPCSTRHTKGEPTQASHPAGVRMHLGTFVQNQPVELMTPAAAVAALLFALVAFLYITFADDRSISHQAAVTTPLAALTAGIMFIFGSAWRYRNWRSLFQDGNLCPAVVISVSPPRLAVFTDMSTGQSGPQEVIKIIAHNMKEIDGQPPYVGQKVPTAAYYFGDPHKRRWEEFNPTPIQYATEEQAAVEYALSAMDPSEWRQLEQGLRKIGPVVRPDYYWLRD